MDAGGIPPAWLSAALGVGVDDFSVTPLESGVVSDVLRLHDVRYSSPPGNLPVSFVLKVPTRAAERRALAVPNGLYLKELNFFRFLAPDAPIRSPQLYASVDDGLP